MDKISSSVAWRLRRAMAGKPGHEHANDGVATVMRRDTDGSVWVRLPGSTIDTPVNGTTSAACEPGQTVAYHLENGRLSVTGNASDPAAGQSTVRQVSEGVERVETRVESVRTELVEADRVQAGEIEAAAARIGSVEADTAKIHDLTADQLSAATGYIGALTAGNVTAQNIIADKAKLAQVDVQQIDADHATIGTLDTTYATITNLDSATARIGTIESDYLKAADMTAEQARVGTLLAGKADVDDLDAATARIGDLEADHVTVSEFEAEQANIDALQVNTADIATIRANAAKVQNLTAAQLEADHATIGTLDTTYMHADMSNSDVAWISNGVIANGAISSAMINDVSANKLTAGTINGSVINVTNLNADNITAGTINGQRIGEGSLSLSKLEDDVYTEAEVDEKLSTMQAEIDGAIETWTGTAVPTLQNAPASGWTTTADRDRHVGDVYFVVNSQSQQNGYNYRFTKSGSTYSWQLIKDTDITNALQRLTTAEGKITTFDSDISTLKTDTGTLTTKTQSLETSLGDKADITTVNEISDTVDGHTQSITQLTTKTTTALSRGVEYINGTQTAATGSWTGVTTDSSLYTGKTIAYRLPYAGSGNASLQLKDSNGNNVGGNIAVYMNNTRVNTHYPANTVIKMTYDGTYWRTDNYDSNNYDRERYSASVTAAAAIAAGRIGVFGTDGKLKLLAASAFDMTRPILYVGTEYKADALTQTNNYVYYGAPFALTNTHAIAGAAAGKAVYIVGTVSNNVMTPTSTVLTCTEPATADGYFYLRLGMMATAANAILESNHPIYAYIDGKFQQATPQVVTTVNKVSEHTQTIDGIQTTIGSLQTTVATKADNSTVTTISNKLNTVSDTVDGHTQSISNVTTIANGVRDDLDNLSIGGRNLLKLSDTLASSCWVLSEATTAVDGVATLPTSSRIYQMPASGYWTWENDTDYVVSIEAKADQDGGKISFNAVGANVTSPLINVTTSWQRYSFSFTSTGTVGTGSMSFFNQNSSSSVVQFRLPKLEKGTKATEWSPAPEDMATASRVAAAETRITQNENAISLRATKTEAYQFAQPNLSPFLSRELDDVYSAEANPGGYWRRTPPYTTMLEDGWAHIECSNSSSGSVWITQYASLEWQQANSPIKIGGVTYTALMEVRNAVLSGNALVYPLSNATSNNTGMFGTTVKGPGGGTEISAPIADGPFYSVAKTRSDFSNVVTVTRSLVEVKSGATLSCDIRISLYEGEYSGPYKPYGGTGVYATAAELKVQADSIDLKVSKNDVINQINVSTEGATIAANRVNIEGAAIFSSGRLSQTSLNNAYDAKGAAATVQTNLDNLEIGGRNLVYSSGDYTGWLKDSVTTFSGDELDINVSGQTANKFYGAKQWLTRTSNDLDGSSIVVSFEVYSDAWESVTSDRSAGFESVIMQIASVTNPYGSSAQGAVGLYRYMSLSGSIHWTKLPTQENGKWLKFESIPIDIPAGLINTDLGTEFKPYLMVQPMLRRNGHVKFRRIKVETGTKASAWSPAPEDQTAYVDSIQIGGTNLLAWSDRKGATSTSSSGLSWTHGIDGWITVTGTINSSSAGILLFWGTTTVSNYVYPAGTYTLTVENDGLLAANVLRVQIGYDNNAYKYINDSDSITFTAESGISRVCLYRYGANGTAVNGRIRFKMEKGNKATDWSPAPEDVDASIETASGNGFYVKWDENQSNTYAGGEARFYAYDPVTKTKGTGVGWVLWNGVKRTVPSTTFNPNSAYPYNIPIYLVLRLSSATSTTGTIYAVWYKDGWKWGYPDATTDGTIYNWTWVEATDIVLASCVEPAQEEQFTDCQTYDPPLLCTQVTTITTTAASAQALATTANTTANNAAPKANAVKRTQRIWYRSNSATKPSTPGTASSNWVTKEDDGNLAWTKMHVAISSTHKYIYTCEQYELASGTVGYTTVLLDNTITVIDGGNIITGTVSANAVNASSGTFDTANIPNLSAAKITSGTIDAARIDASQLTIGGSGLATTDDIPTKVSELTNDSSFATTSDVSTAVKSISQNWFATCTTAAATKDKVATITPATTDFTLKAGATVNVKFSNTNTYNATASSNVTLNVNSTGAKNIYYGSSSAPTGTNTTPFGRANYTNTYVYDGTYWVWVSSSADNNTTDVPRSKYEVNIFAAAAVTAGHIICGTSSGYRNIAASVSFDLNYPLLYANTTITAEATTGTRNNNFMKFQSANFSNNGTITSGDASKMLYLKGTVDGKTFTISTSPFMTTVVPTSDDGLAYIPLGYMSSPTVGYFDSSADVYAFRNGAFQKLDTVAKYITAITEEGIRVHAKNNSTTNYAAIDADGMDVVKGGVSVAQFGEGTRIGAAADAHMELTGEGLDLFTQEGVASFGVHNTGGSHEETRYTVAQHLGASGTVLNLTTSTAEQSAGIVQSHVLSTTATLDRIMVGVRVSLYDASTGRPISTNRQAQQRVELTAGSAYYTSSFTMFSGDQQLTYRFRITYVANSNALTVMLYASHASTDYRHQVQGFVASVGYMETLTVLDPSIQFGAGLSGAAGSYSVALGQGVNTGASNQTAVGRWNIDHGASAFEVGNGTGEDDRSNAMSLEWDGKLNLIDQDMPTAAPSDSYYAPTGVHFYGGDGDETAASDAIGYVRPLHRNDDRRGVQIEAQRYVNDTRYSNPVTLMVDGSGNPYVTLNRTAWLRALGICSGSVAALGNTNASAYKDKSVSFGMTYSSAPNVIVGLQSDSTAGTFGRCSVSAHSVTTTGFTFRFFNGDSSARNPSFYWIAIGTPVN